MKDIKTLARTTLRCSRVENSSGNFSSLIYDEAFQSLALKRVRENLVRLARGKFISVALLDDSTGCGSMLCRRSSFNALRVVFVLKKKNISNAEATVKKSLNWKNMCDGCGCRAFFITSTTRMEHEREIQMNFDFSGPHETAEKKTRWLCEAENRAAKAFVKKWEHKAPDNLSRCLKIRSVRI